MTEKSAITLTVNGRNHSIAVEPRRTLADAIREDCGQTGTHIGCEHGVCGACTVLFDGETVRSCIMFAVQADGQVHGGVAQGIGNALLEEIVYDENGGILTANLADYMPPTAHEVPPIELHHIETPSTTSITKAKGLGEGGCIGAPAAIINAINDALSEYGVEIDEMPATPERIRAALRATGKTA